MAIKLYIGGKEAFKKKSKPSQEFVIDPAFSEAAEAHSERLDSLLGDFLEKLEQEKKQRKARLAEAEREQEEPDPS